MGQYYYILAKEENKNSKVYNRDLIINGKKEYVTGMATENLFLLTKLTQKNWLYA